MGRFDIGAYLRIVRETAGLTHQQLCEIEDGNEICTIENLSYIENGKRHPNPHTLVMMLEKLGKNKVFGNCYPQTQEYEVIVLDKELTLMMSEFRYKEAEQILGKIEKNCMRDIY